MKNIFAYRFGDFLVDGAFLIINTLFIVFLSNLANIPPQYAGLIIMFYKSWDTISDPLVGILSDRFKSKIGRCNVLFF